MRSRPITLAILAAAIGAGVASWIVNAVTVNHWLAVHTGTVNESGPYYGFWSGFGSDIAEFGLIGAVGTGVYQLVRKYNCHEPRCWRIGNHSAAGGQFLLCYRHHPDYNGTRPSSDMIKRLHRLHQERQASLDGKLHRIHGASTRPTDHNTPATNEAHGAPMTETSTSDLLTVHHQENDGRP